MTELRGWRWPALALCLLAAGGCSSGEPVERHPLVVVGVDGGEWRVIERLWEEGRLPHLKALADRGVTATLRTDYTASPVIWTTIATGVVPAAHGITDFVVATPRGDVPVSSSLRRVPALWNMVSAAGGRVGVVGWWASWPAEEVTGVVISDRALLEVPDGVYPPELVPRFQQWVAEADARANPFQGNELAARRDQVATHAACRLLESEPPFDLLLVYYRSVDIASHNHWKYFEPEAFDDVDPRLLAEQGGIIPAAYEAVDQALGRIAAAAGEGVNLLVISDHGFHPARGEQLQLMLDFDAVLERLGYLERGKAGVDFSASRFYTHATPDHRRQKRVRFSLAGREPGGSVQPAERAALRRRLEEDLSRVTYQSGAPAFRVRDPRERERRQGADLVVVALPDAPTETLLVDGQPFDGAVEHVGWISGTHSRRTHGILLAAGPDIDPEADLEGIRIHDVAPTLLYGLGLPVARDFAGRAWRELYTRAFRRGVSLAEIDSWGTRAGEGAATSAVDEELVDELRALGYLN